MQKHANAEAIFWEALDQDPSDRAAYLERVCAGNELLYREVESLLDSHKNIGTFLERPLFEVKGVADLAASDSTNSEDATHFLTPSSEPGSLGRLDHYEVLEIVGKGGTGIVLRARDTKLVRVVAIKVLAASLATSGAARQRFAREARAAACVRDDHVIAIYAVEDRGSFPYLVMEFIQGCTLEALIRRNGALGVNEILRIGVQVASGLAAAHKQGLIHRDIKPANILLENGVHRVKLSDFGLARSADDASLTQTGIIAGTPLYMSPEQANGELIDHRSDLFSLGSVLYEMCTGRPAFRAPNTAAVLRRVSDEQPRSIHELNPEIPESLCSVIEQLQAKNPNDRPSSAYIVADTLSHLLSQMNGLESVTSSATSYFPINKTVKKTVASDNQRRGLTSHLRTWIAAAFVLVAVGLALGDTTGVTNVRGTVIRLFSAQGTLVVEVDDPSVNVTVDGGEVVITNAGAGEIRLKPGQYKVEASKNGKLVQRELITVTRNGRQVVRISQEETTSTRSTYIIPKFKRSLIGHMNGVISVRYAPNGRLLATGDLNGEVRVWDVPACTLRYSLPANGKCVHALAFSPDSKYLVTAAEDQMPQEIMITVAETGKPDGVLKGHTSGLYDVTFTPDGKTLISGGWDGTLQFWDFMTRQQVKKISTPDGKWIRSFALTTDGQLLIGGMNLFLFRPSGELRKKVETAIGPLCYSPNEKKFAGTIWSEGLVTLWDSETCEQISSWQVHSGRANGVVFSPQGRFIVTAGSDGAVRFWEVATKQLVGELRHVGEAYQIAFSPDGGTLATTGIDDRLVKLWDVSFLRKIDAPEKNE